MNLRLLLFSPFLPDMYGTFFTLLYDESIFVGRSRLRAGVQELRCDRISNQRGPPTMCIRKGEIRSTSRAGHFVASTFIET